MKGFPNQVAELAKVTTGMKCLLDLVEAGENARDDGVFGPELVRVGVAGRGHRPTPIEDYIRHQLTKKPSGQSFRTTARGLRELYRLLGFIDDAGGAVHVNDLGREAAAFADSETNDEQVRFWRRVLRDMTYTDGRGVSHPYQMLLRLVARKPGISRAKCALALEAIDDSDEELQRLLELSDLPEPQIRLRIGATESNWNNAKKVLPKFAEQLRDVIRTGGRDPTYVLADAPGRAAEGRAEPPTETDPTRASGGARAPRSARQVTPATIGQAGIAERSPEFAEPPEADPAKVAEGRRQRADRLRRHNLLVREFARRLGDAGARLFEDPFDILGLLAGAGILIEVKTLDGTPENQRERVRDALSQLLYYEAFVTRPIAGETPIRKIALFEQRLTDPHREFLNTNSIATVWKQEARFIGDAMATTYLGSCLDEFR